MNGTPEGDLWEVCYSRTVHQCRVARIVGKDRDQVIRTVMEHHGVPMDADEPPRLQANSEDMCDIEDYQDVADLDAGVLNSTPGQPDLIDEIRVDWVRPYWRHRLFCLAWPKPEPVEDPGMLIDGTIFAGQIHRNGWPHDRRPEKVGCALVYPHWNLGCEIAEVRVSPATLALMRDTLGESRLRNQDVRLVDHAHEIQIYPPQGQPDVEHMIGPPYEVLEVDASGLSTEDPVLTEDARQLLLSGILLREDS